MNNELLDVWQVTYEMILKEEIEDTVYGFFGRPVNEDTFQEMHEAVNEVLNHFFPDKFKIDLDDTFYVLDSFEILLDLGTITSVRIKPHFTQELSKINITLSLNL